MRLLVIGTGRAPDGWTAQTAASGQAGFDLARAYAHDAVLMDLVLPDTTGRDLLRRLRHDGLEAPIIALAPTPDPITVVDALALGADDCLPQAVAPSELAARLAAVVRRARGFCRPVIHIGPLSVNLSSRTASVGPRPLPLTAKEYELLELLALRKDAVVTRETILDQLYGGLDEPDSRAVDVHICRLRRKIGEDGIIHTCWGRGFMLGETLAAARPLAA